jgi:hypothetical protein
MMALGCLGQRAFDSAEQQLSTVLALNPTHVGAARHHVLLRELKEGTP